jgi:predicted flap endonuclease-1-like 5' DNA nuclease
MPAFTTNQWVVLFLVLVLGWLLGLISRSGGAKWRRAYEAERDARVEEQRENAAALETAHARIAELERLTPAAAVASAKAIDPTAASSTSATLDLTRDNLAHIRGIGPVGEADLNEQGIYRYADLAALTPEEEATLEDHLGADRGYIAQERWREQAALLAEGQLDEHRARFG